MKSKPPPIKFEWSTSKWVIEATVDPETLEVTRLGGWGDFSTDTALARKAEAVATVRALKLEAAERRRSEKARENGKKNKGGADRYSEARRQFTEKVAGFRYRHKNRWPTIGDGVAILVKLGAGAEFATPTDRSTARRWLRALGKPPGRKCVTKRRS